MLTQFMKVMGDSFRPVFIALPATGTVSKRDRALLAGRQVNRRPYAAQFAGPPALRLTPLGIFFLPGHERVLPGRLLKPAAISQLPRRGRRRRRSIVVGRKVANCLTSKGAFGHDLDKIVATTCRTGPELWPLGGFLQCLGFFVPVSR
jgi:hypothetical protein